mmetsp:Transcript_25152/g.50323  ORF Transcript_25152/g.50323 Transcript_25152/m.50323 type:complete len:528 (+) Transcript_25152:259-1842(+)
MAEEIRNKFVSWTQNIVKEIREIPHTPIRRQQTRRPLRPRSSLPPAPDGMVWEVDEIKWQWCLQPESKVGGKDDSGSSTIGGDAGADVKGEGAKDVHVAERDVGKVVEVVVHAVESSVEKNHVNEQVEISQEDGNADKTISTEKRTNNIKEKSSSQQIKELTGSDSTKAKSSASNTNLVVSPHNDGPRNQMQNCTTPKRKNGQQTLLRSSSEEKSSFDDDEQPFQEPSSTIYNSTINNNNNNNNNNHEISSLLGGESSIEGDNTWELISERSGSTAVLISVSGSILSGSSSFNFRSTSPGNPHSMPYCNKFILAEHDADKPYLEHVVLPTDTLQGLCLAYKISATKLRMENNFSGNSLQMAPKKLKIPVISSAVANFDKKNKTNTTKVDGVGDAPSSSGDGRTNNNNNNNNNTIMIRMQDKSTKEYKLYAFLAEIISSELVEAKAYLDLNNWDLEEALSQAKEDKANGGCCFLMDNLDDISKIGGSLGDGCCGSFDEDVDFGPLPATLDAVAKPKALTPQDIHSVSP